MPGASRDAPPVEALPVLALHRYWLWADFQRRVMLELGDKHKASGQSIDAVVHAFDGMAALSFYYAALYVVIEGWGELGLTDPEIDGLLVSDNTDRLRRFRNGVYHYQTNFDDPRFLGFLDDADEPVDWVKAVHSAFARWFNDWGRATFGYGPEDLREWTRAEREAAQPPDQAEQG